MDMGTGIMDKQKKLINFLNKKNRFSKGLVIVFTVIYLPVANGKLFGFRLSPYFTLNQIYSDNLTYGYGSTNSLINEPVGGFVTELLPGVNIVRNSSRSSFNLNYRLQFQNYEGIDIEPRVFNQLQMTGKTEIYNKSLFVDSSSTISQSNLSAQGGFSPDNVGRALGAGYTTYRAFRISPYWLINSNRFVNGEIRFAYSSFGNNGSADLNIGQPTNTINLDSNTYQQTVSLRNGKHFQTIGWRVIVNNQEQYNQGAAVNTFDNSIIRFRSVNGEISYKLGLYDLNAFVQSGYYDNSYPSNLATNNGLYITPGLSWIPSSKFQLAIGYGYNANFSNITWHPSERTTFQFSYRDSKVGGSNNGGLYGIGGVTTANFSTPGFDTNSGSASGGAMGSTIGGTSYNGVFQHRTRTILFNTSYITTSGTAQQFLSSIPTFTQSTDINGIPVGDPVANSRLINLFNLNNDVMVIKRAQLSLTWYLQKTTFTMTGFQNNISYVSGAYPPQDMYGFNANWTWRFAQRMNASIGGTWQTSEFSNGSNLTGGNRRTDFASVALTITRQLSSFSTAYLQFNHYQSDYNGLTGISSISNNLGNYESNRITASINIRF